MTEVGNGRKDDCAIHGNVFYFGCAGCKDKFEKQHDKYALAAAE